LPPHRNHLDHGVGNNAVVDWVVDWVDLVT